jgi:voltage-gated potassium channel
MLDSLYMAVITLSTVGFGEVRPLSPVGKLFTIGLILGGGGLAMYLGTGLAEFLLSGEGRAYWKQRQLTRMLAKLSNHVIVCGYGRVGRHVARELAAEGLPFAVIDPSPEKIKEVEQAGFVALQGNAANEHLLSQAGIARARGLVVGANSDAENVFIVLSARSVRSDLLIVARAIDEESESKLLKAGASRVILPYRFSGRRMVTMLIRPEVANFLDEVAHSSGLELFLEQFRLSPTSPLVGQTLEQSRWRARFGVTVLACKLADGRINTSPQADTVLTAAMKMIVLGTREQLRGLTELPQGSLEAP